MRLNVLHADNVWYSRKTQQNASVIHLKAGDELLSTQCWEFADDNFPRFVSMIRMRTPRPEQ